MNLILLCEVESVTKRPLMSGKGDYWSVRFTVCGQPLMVPLWDSLATNTPSARTRLEECLEAAGALNVRNLKGKRVYLHIREREYRGVPRWSVERWMKVEA